MSHKQRMDLEYKLERLMVDISQEEAIIECRKKILVRLANKAQRIQNKLEALKHAPQN